MAKYLYIANKCKIPSEIDTEVSNVFESLEACESEGKLLLKKGFDVILIVRITSYGEGEIIKSEYR